MATELPAEGQRSSQDLDMLLMRLKQGDPSAMKQVTRENVIALLDRARDDLEVVQLLKQKL